VPEERRYLITRSSELNCWPTIIAANVRTIRDFCSVNPVAIWEVDPAAPRWSSNLVPCRVGIHLLVLRERRLFIENCKQPVLTAITYREGLAERTFHQPGRCRVVSEIAVFLPLSERTLHINPLDPQELAVF
jgi:hypothetical protein